MFNAINSGVSAGLSVLGSILGIMIFFMIIKKGPGVFSNLAEAINDLMKYICIKIKTKLIEEKKKDPPVEEKKEEESPTFEEFVEWWKTHPNKS